MTMTVDPVRNAQADLDDIDKQIAALEERRVKIQAYLEMSAFYAQPRTGGPGQLPLDLKGMTIADGCEAIMKAHGGQAKATDIIKALRESGKMKGQGRGDYGTVVQTLQRFPDRFEKVAPGLWRLKHEEQPVGVLARVLADSHRNAQVTGRAGDHFEPSNASRNGVVSVGGYPVATG